MTLYLWQAGFGFAAPADSMQGVVTSIPITLSGIPGGIINIPIDQDGQGDNSLKDIQRGLYQDRLCFRRLDIVSVSLSC